MSTSAVFHRLPVLAGKRAGRVDDALFYLGPQIQNTKKLVKTGTGIDSSRNKVSFDTSLQSVQ